MRDQVTIDIRPRTGLSKQQFVKAVIGNKNVGIPELLEITPDEVSNMQSEGVSAGGKEIGLHV